MPPSAIEERRLKISFGSWALVLGPYAGHPVALEDVIRRVSEAGYDGIELCGFPPHATTQVYANTESRQELARMLSDHGLGISG